MADRHLRFTRTAPGRLPTRRLPSGAVNGPVVRVRGQSLLGA
jgi:hypothetical protein